MEKYFALFSKTFFLKR